MALFGAGADELAGRHTPVGDLWGARVASMREQLEEASSPERRLELLERMLMARLPRVCGLDPGVAQALEGLLTASNVHYVVRQSGYSHRTFISMFSRSVGLTPKLYSRVLRFQHAVRRAFAGGEPWVEVAIAAGYSDQSHSIEIFASSRASRRVSIAAAALYSRTTFRFIAALSDQGQICTRLDGADRAAMLTHALLMHMRRRALMAVHELFAYLCVRNASEAIDFYRRAFGAHEKFRLTEPSGRIGHAELDFGGTTLMLADEFPECGFHAPQPGSGTAVTIHVHVENADAVIRQAVEAGAAIEREPRDEFDGERSGVIRDPFRDRWNIGHHIEDVSRDEMQRRYSEAPQHQ